MSTRRALGVSAIAQVITFGLSFLNVIVVARLLTPEEIGVFSVAVSTLGIAHVFREFGVTQYLVQTKEVTRDIFRAAFTLTLIGSWSIAITLFLARGALADFYDHDGIADVLSLMALNFVVLPLGTPLLAILRRELRFGTLAWLRIANAATTTVVTIGAALSGESYLSMAWGALAGHLTNVVMLNILRPGQIFMLPSTRGMKEVFGFGSLSSLITLLREIGSASHGLILGRTLGFSDVAYYSRAAGLRDMFLGELNRLVNSVHFPTFAKQIREGGDAAKLYLTAAHYLTGITIPAMALLALLAEELILFFFGSQWIRSAPLASILCTFAIVMTPYALGNLSLIASGHIGQVLRIELLVQGTRVVTLCTSVWFPLETIVPLLGLVFCLEAMAYQYALTRSFALTFSAMSSAIGRSLLLIPFTLAGPLLLRFAFPMEATDTLHLFIVLATSGIMAALGWLVGLRILKHPIGTELIGLARRILLSR